MPHAYTEDQLVEQPAIQLFAELGWTIVSAFEEILGAHGTLSRETTGQVVLESRLRAALVRLNAFLPSEALDAAVVDLTRDRSAMMAIQDTLDEGLPRVYSPDLYQQKCGVVFEHFYESYSDKDANIYSAAG